MNMNQFSKLLLIALGTSITTITLYDAFFAHNKKETIVIRERNNSSMSDWKAVNANYTGEENQGRERLQGETPELVNAAQIATPAVVHITGKAKSRGRYDDFFNGASSSGSGVIVSSDGYILTNNHVVENATDLEVTLNDRRVFEAKMVGTDPSTDLALIKIGVADLAYLKFADSDLAEVGEWVLAVGNPFNLTSTVTAGIISAKGRNIDILDGNQSIESFIQTDAAVNPGNSGGALVNTKGELIGINTAIVTRSGRYEGYSFAVPSRLAEKVMRDIRDYGSLQRGLMGVTITDIPTNVVREQNLESYEGVYLSGLEDEGAADKAGLKQGDIITHINAKRVKSAPELQEMVARFRPGDKVNLKIYRKGKSIDYTITLTGKEEASLLKNLGFDQVRPLSNDEIKKYKTKGILVTTIRENSKIARTNMEKDFIITKANGKQIETVPELLNILSTVEGKIVLDGVYTQYEGRYSYTFEK